MRNILLVLKHEVLTVLRKPSFWVMTFLFPLLILGLNLGVQITSRHAFETDETISGPQATQVGYVDEAGLIVTMPSQVPAGLFVEFADRDAALAALAANEIDRYYIVPPDALDTGDLVVVVETFRPFANTTSDALFEYALAYNLVDDPQLAPLVLDPAPVAARQEVRVEGLAGEPGGQERPSMSDNPFSFWVPFAVLFVFFFSLTMSSGLMLTSVSREKENRTAEVLLLSLRPRELMLGKIAGLGLVALLQMLAWTAGGMLLINRGGALLGGALAGFHLPAGFLAWVLLYFLFGYGVYASAMAALGVLAPTAREAAQFTFILMLPLMLPMWLNSVFINDPHGTLATVFSLFPLTAPVAMVTRIASGGVPLWQTLVGLVGLALTAYGFVLLAARLFRADTLLSLESLNWERLLREVRR